LFLKAPMIFNKQQIPSQPISIALIHQLTGSRSDTLRTLLSHHCRGSAKYSSQTCSIVSASPDSTGTYIAYVSHILSVRDGQHPLLLMKMGIWYIPEALVLIDALLRTGDRHLSSPLLLPPWELDTNKKEGCTRHGDFESVITQGYWSHASPSMRQKNIDGSLNFGYSSVLIFDVLPNSCPVNLEKSSILFIKYCCGGTWLNRLNTYVSTVDTVVLCTQLPSHPSTKLTL